MLQYEEETSRTHVWLRAFFMGPTGSGKSRGALELASKLFDGSLHTTLINTERGRERLYADRYKYSLINLAPDEGKSNFSPAAYIEALDLAEAKHPGGVIILDSVSHEWMGEGGILQQADRFGDWKKVRPLHNEWVERILACQCHVIACCRAKMKYGVEEKEEGGRKKQVISMLGVGPVQSDDLQYEFNLVAAFEQTTHEATFSGHVDPLIGITTQVVPGDEVASVLTAWLSEGDAPPEPEAASTEAIAELAALLALEGIPAETIEAGFATMRKLNRGVMHPDLVAEKLEAARKRAEDAALPFGDDDPPVDPDADAIPFGE